MQPREDSSDGALGQQETRSPFPALDHSSSAHLEAACLGIGGDARCDSSQDMTVKAVSNDVHRARCNDPSILAEGCR